MLGHLKGFKYSKQLLEFLWPYQRSLWSLQRSQLFVSTAGVYLLPAFAGTGGTATVFSTWNLLWIVSVPAPCLQCGYFWLQAQPKAHSYVPARILISGTPSDCKRMSTTSSSKTQVTPSLDSLSQGYHEGYLAFFSMKLWFWLNWESEFGNSEM